MKRVVLLLLGVLISVGCFAWSLQGTSLAELRAAFSRADYRTLPLLLALLAGFYWLKTLRWVWLLAPVARLKTSQLFPPMLIGFAANNLLPAHLGEFVRVSLVHRRYGIPASTVLSTVVLERIFDVLAILALFAVGLTATAELPESYRRSAVILGCLAFAVVLAVVVYLIWTEWFVQLLGRICSWAPFLPDAVGHKVVGMLRTGADGLAALRSGPMVLAITLSSLLQWLLNGLLAYVALRAFEIPVTVATGLIVTGVTAVGVTVPSTPGYFGVIQLCFQVSMNAQAVRPDPSLVLGSSLYYHMSMYFPVTILGLYFLYHFGLQLTDLQSAAEHVADDEPQDSAENPPAADSGQAPASAADDEARPPGPEGSDLSIVS